MTGLGFVGLGRMGSGMALNLLKAAGTLNVFDMSADASGPLGEAGATVCDSIAELAARSDTILLCLPSAPQVRAALFGPEGIAGVRREGLTVFDATTLDRTDALEFAHEAEDAGFDYWDCPVSGMPHRAQEGTLTVMFGGTEPAFATARPLLQSFASDVIHCGPVGSGQAMKAVNNIIYNVNIVALCEVLPLAVAAGLDPEALRQTVTTASSRSFASEYFVPRMMARKFDTDFALQDAYKDIVNVQRMGVEQRAMLPVVNAMIASYQAAIAAGHGAEPKSAMIKIYEQALGVTFENPAEASSAPDTE